MDCEKRHCGQGVGSGFIVAAARFLDAMISGPGLATHDAHANRSMLESAMEATGGRLRRRMEESDDETSAILEFQLELLDDPALCDGVWPAIAEGVTADRAWRTAMEEQIAPFEIDDDEYFRARAADLRDLRDSVLAELFGGSVADDKSEFVGVASDIGPSRFLELCDLGMVGLLLEAGSASSHVAILARARGLPLVIQAGSIADCREIALDAAGGVAFTDPTQSTKNRFSLSAAAAGELYERGLELLRGPALTGKGERIWTYLNVDAPESVDRSMLSAADGVGLWRTEFLFVGRSEPPSEDEQYAVMAEIAKSMEGRPLVVRTLDIGGDKPVEFLALEPETNPFLGLRGIRLCLARPEIWRSQIRALLRLGADYPVKVMLPMVTRPDELQSARAFIGEASEGLSSYRIPEIGIMVETPASAIACDLFDADFYSIGTNDLVQYVTAAARDAGSQVAKLADPLDPAVMRLIAQVIRHGKTTNKQVSLCGDMAAVPECARELLKIGLRHFSVGQAALPQLRTTIADFNQ